MENLLTKQENRRLEFITILTKGEDWLTLTELASDLDCSTRVLTEDINFLNTYSNSLSIKTSTLGAKVQFHKNKGPKNFAEELLAESTAYQLLEMIFFNDKMTVNDLAELLFISPPTVYRMINQLNPSLQEIHGFQIETNPCQIVGSEENIRYFFYLYFFERYPRFDFPYNGVSEKTIDLFLKALVKYSSIPIDFSFYNVFKVIVMVNITRYNNKYYVKIDKQQRKEAVLSSAFRDLTKFFTSVGMMIRQTIDEGFITQVFTQYIKKGFFFSPEQMLSEAEKDAVLLSQVTFLRETIDRIALKNNLVLKNRDNLIFALLNTAHLEYHEPQSGYILYNRNQFFVDDLAKEFPQFHKDLYHGMKEFREVLHKPITEDGIAFYIYTAFSNWDNIVPQLRQKLDKIKVLVISDRSKKHAEMIKDFIAYEFSKQLEIDFFTALELNSEVLKQLEYDLIVTTFTIEELENSRSVYIPNIPKYKDYQMIQRQIDGIVLDRTE